METQKYVFHVDGMHCKSCVLTIESELEELNYVKKAKPNLSGHFLEVEGEFGEKSKEIIAEEFSRALEGKGYTVSVEKQVREKKWSEFKIAVPVAIGFGLLFFFLQKIGLVNLIGSGKVSYGTSFVIGIVASLSTCMAVVGGLLLSISATFARKENKTKPQILFHIGRLVSFFVLGGVIGALGSAFQLNVSANFILSIVIGLVMLVLGINLLDIFDFAKRFQPSMPKFISRHALGVSKINHTLTPLLIGLMTFFLPCGFTQSMQVYTLSLGNFLSGGLTMLSFALGTFPVLALISFSSFSIQSKSRSGIFFKSAGLVVIMFALFNLINSLAVLGLIPPLFNF